MLGCGGKFGYGKWFRALRWQVLRQKEKGLYLKPKGTYIRAFSIGSWDKIPALYEKILTFATDHNLTPGEYAFEIGINEFAVSSPEDYVTQIELPCTADETPAYPHNR